MDNCFGFVILHFNAFESTIDSVKSITDNCDKCVVVIVDNASPNGSGVLLEKKYADNDYIKVILLNENMGFAKGNNEGYRYLRENYSCNFICVMNNDVLILDNDFCERIINIYNNNSFGVLGPRIIRADDSENIFDCNIKSYSEFCQYKKDIKKTLLKFESKCYLLWCAWWFFSKRFIRKGRNESVCIESNTSDVLLHGCCLVFSEEYITKFDNAFYSKTFLYLEEELLFLRCLRNGLHTFYTDEITVKHLEDVSTNSIISSNRDKEIKKMKCLLDSIEIVLNVLNDSSNLLTD